MIRVLFVDDDPEVLASLRHLLHRQEREWDRCSCRSSRRGHRRARPEPADVVVLRHADAGDGRHAAIPRARRATCIPARRASSCPETPSTFARQALPLCAPVSRQAVPLADQLVDAVNRTPPLHRILTSPVSRTLIVGPGSAADRAASSYLASSRGSRRGRRRRSTTLPSASSGPGARRQDAGRWGTRWFGRERRLTSVREAAAVTSATDVLRGLALGGQVFGTMTIAPFEGFSLEGLAAAALHPRGWRPACSKGRRASTTSSRPHGPRHRPGLALADGPSAKKCVEVPRPARSSERRPFHDVDHRRLLGATSRRHRRLPARHVREPFPIVEATAYHHSPRRVAAASGACSPRVHLVDVLMSHGRTDRERSHAGAAARHRLPRLRAAFVPSCRWSRLRARNRTRPQ